MPRIPLRSFLLLIAVCGLCGSLSSQVFQYDYDGIQGPAAQLSDIDGDGIPEYLAVECRNQEFFIQIYSLALNQPLVEWGLGANNSGPSLENLPMPFDLNQDGFLDIVYLRATSLNATTLTAYSGLDGTLLWERSDFLAPNYLTREPVAIGDRNGDGIVDFINPLECGEIVHISGADGSTLQRNPSGFFIAARDYHPAGDLDGDGIPDYFAEDFSSAWAFSGATDTVLFSLPPGIERRGHSLAAVGDVNGDGYDDFAYFPAETFEGRQPLEVWTGSPPRRLGIVPGHHHGEKSQAYPILHYDWDGDGIEDIATWGEEGDLNTFLPNPPYFRIHSFARGEDLLVQPTGHMLFPFAYAAVFLQEDYDGDGKPDVLYSTVDNNNAVEVLSLKEHVQVSATSISQSAGGSLTFDVDVTPRFAGKDAFLLIGAPGSYRDEAIFDGREWFFKHNGYQEFLPLPFGRLPLTNRLWSLRRDDDPHASKFTLTLDAQGKGTLMVLIPPGGIDVGRIGRGLSFAFLLPDLLLPEFPDGITEAVTMEVLP